MCVTTQLAIKGVVYLGLLYLGLLFSGTEFRAPIFKVRLSTPAVRGSTWARSYWAIDSDSFDLWLMKTLGRSVAEGCSSIIPWNSIGLISFLMRAEHYY